MTDSFFSLGQASDPFYNHIRDNHPDTKAFVERLWQKYKPYAEPNFLEDAKKDFHAKTWEMYLGYLFLENDFDIQKKTQKEGPDLHLLWNDYSIWVEATAPGSGTGANAVPDYKFNEVSYQPEEQIILRLISAIEEKFKKYKSYIDKGVIKGNDFYIIAVNGGRIRYAIMEQHIPYIVKSVFPFGNLVLSLSKESMEIVNSHYEYRDIITTAKGSPVPTNIFERRDYAGISAIFYSWMNIVNRPNKIGDEVHLVHNPLADNKLPPGLFPFGIKWRAENNQLIRKDYNKKK